MLPRLDAFGGLMGSPCPSGPAKHFYTAKIDHRWVLCTPAGNRMWMLAVYQVISDDHVDELKSSYSKRIALKYGSTDAWSQAQAMRLKAWGFNAVGPYAHYSMWQKLPSYHLAKATPSAFENRFGLAPGPTKNLIQGLDPKYWAGWRGGHFPDVFDPNFEIFWNNYMAQDRLGVRAMYSSPHLLGIGTDDRDDLFLFGPGNDVPNCCAHEHLGRAALVMAPTQSRTGAGTPLTDTKVYTKLALRDLLKARYEGDIARLNAAWGAAYTGWDSDGGWGSGNGLLDENGRHRWVGKDEVDLSDITAAMRRDLDDFLYQIARRYFEVTTTAIRRALGKEKVLIFGPSTFNTYGLTRPPILRAAGEFCDVVQATVDGGPKAVELTYKYIGQKPFVTWETAVANPDSPLWRDRITGQMWAVATQQARAELYARNALDRFNARDPLTGDYPIIGLSYWEFHDNYGERRNFGLVSLSDNAYDGQEAVAGTVRCQWPLDNYTCGREERNYGNFLGGARRANLQILRSLAGAASGSPGSGSNR